LDLDTIERRNDHLCLGRWTTRLSVGPVGDGQGVVLHTTNPATPPAMLEPITWSAAFTEFLNILSLSTLSRFQNATLLRIRNVGLNHILLNFT
jgi:hypothetical protein